MKIGILNLGCPRNIVDAENILGRLSLKGYKITEVAKADIAIINTCAFINDAKKESVDAILDLIELKKEGKLKKVIVAGCLSQRYKHELIKELPEVDAFIGKISLNHSSGRFAITPKYYAYLKICEGCVNNCSYCVIPKIKGRFESLPIESVIKRVCSLSKKKISELNIIGQDISGYGIDLYGKRNLPELLKKIIEAAKDIHWIRLLYLYPDAIVNDLIELIKDNPKICRYIDLPIQHINDRVLKLMNRHREKKDILKLINKLRKNIPDIALRTSVIVGFPSETDKEFKELLQFIEDVQFERLGAFIYSREEGTPAYNLKPQINHKIKVERFNAVMSAQQKISIKVNEKFLGKTIEVLIEEKHKEYYLGRSQYDAPEVDGMVYVKSSRKLFSGEFVRAKIIDTLEYDLAGEIIE